MGRDAIGCALLGDRLIVVGGYDGNHALKSVEEYDPVRNGWNELAPMAFARAGACVVAIPNVIPPAAQQPPPSATV
ncbi:hypothetical protein M5D96_013883 [Drosophila gunungcola]|uniref:Uncharacterized protein n=1 Tax=Drosophila gunungcola TaxID=103775 RepID=A0A9P9YAF7_9MUSC|nr:hypothetical protein M5D96_013883 [Drosophila gunungcola]